MVIIITQSRKLGSSVRTSKSPVFHTFSKVKNKFFRVLEGFAKARFCFSSVSNVLLGIQSRKSTCVKAQCILRTTNFLKIHKSRVLQNLTFGKRQPKYRYPKSLLFTIFLLRFFCRLLKTVVVSVDKQNRKKVRFHMTRTPLDTVVQTCGACAGGGRDCAVRRRCGGSGGCEMSGGRM